jgi:hypothetical protein
MDTLSPYESRTLDRVLRWTVFLPHPTLPDDCWVWTGQTNRRGYGQLTLCQDRVVQRALVHRWAWLTLRGPIPPGLEPDHLCERQPCWNLHHLEPVTHLENVQRWSQRLQARRAVCFAGRHPWTPDNIGAQNRCKACHRERIAARYVPRPRVPASHCLRGHPRTPDNVDRQKRCRTCLRERPSRLVHPISSQ